MSSRYTALECVLFDAGISRRHVQAIIWSLRAAGDTVPDEDHIAGCLLRWQARHTRQALEAVGYGQPSRQLGLDAVAEPTLWPEHPPLVGLPDVQ